MFEHLDDPQQRERDLIAEYGAVAVLSASMRRRRGIIVTTLALSLVATGGVCGLALGGPDSVHGPVHGGSLFALGDPLSTDTALPPVSLTGSDRTSPGLCPSGADAGRPASTAAVAVAVTDAVVVGTVGNGSPASGSLGGPVSGSATGSMGSVATGAPVAHRATGSGSGSHYGTAGTPHPVVQPPATQRPPVTPVTGGGGGGVQIPDPIVTPPVDTGGGDPTGDPVGDPTIGDPPTDNGGGGDGTQTPSPDPSSVDPLLGLLPSP